MATLLVSGCCRSLQFTSLNAISYADVDATRMGQASSLSGMLQQLVAEPRRRDRRLLARDLRRARGPPRDRARQFLLAFVVVGLISAARRGGHGGCRATPGPKWRAAPVRRGGRRSEHGGAAGRLMLGLLELDFNELDARVADVAHGARLAGFLPEELAAARRHAPFVPIRVDLDQLTAVDDDAHGRRRLLIAGALAPESRTSRQIRTRSLSRICV